jgi:hypothetical protein
LDGERQIMISEALNESDRLSSCNKRARKVMESQAGPFHVYVFEPQSPDSSGDGSTTREAAAANPAVVANPEDAIISYNLGGIRMNQSAFRKLEQEISLVALTAKLPPSAASKKAEYRLSVGTVPVDRDIFRKIVIRESRIARVKPEDFSVQGWSELTYYEVCTDPAIYAALEKDKEKKKAARA